MNVIGPCPFPDTSELMRVVDGCAEPDRARKAIEDRLQYQDEIDGETPAWVQRA